MLVQRNSCVYVFKATQVCCQWSPHLNGSVWPVLRVPNQPQDLAPSVLACSGGPVTRE